MITFWGFVLGLPLLAFGGACLYSPDFVQRFAEGFRANRGVAIGLTAFAWLWTAYECDTIGIDVFDAILLKEASGGLLVWILAVVLTYLTVIWMPKNLPVRALTGLLMLLPAELFKATRPLLPTSGVAAIHVLVVLAYLGALVGMYGMFYPWRLEKGLDLVLKRSALARALGAVLVVFGVAAIIVGVVK